jgi:hypothetical protein
MPAPFIAARKRLRRSSASMAASPSLFAANLSAEHRRSKKAACSCLRASLIYLRPWGLGRMSGYFRWGFKYWLFALFAGIWAAGTARLLFADPGATMVLGVAGSIAAIVGMSLGRLFEGGLATRLSVAFVITAPTFGLLVTILVFMAGGFASTGGVSIFAFWFMVSGLAFLSGGIGTAVFLTLFMVVTYLRRLMIGDSR